MKSGDISTLISLDSPTYAPDRGIGVLIGRTQQNMAEGADNLKRAEDILAEMGLVRRDLASALKTPEEIQESIKRNQVKMDALPVDDTETRKIIEARNNELQAQLANPLDDKQRKEREQELARYDRLLAQTTAARDKLDALVNPVGKEATPESVNALLAEISNPTPTSDTQKNETALITMAMASPHLMPAEKIQELVNNSSFNISENTRNVLRKLSEAQVKTNALKDIPAVRKDIIEGGKGFVGMNQYRAQVARALETGNIKAANRLLSQLGNFTESSANKAAAATQAWNNGKGKGTQILAHSNGSWTVNQGDKVSTAALTKSGSLELNSAALVKAIEAEAQIVAATHAALSEALRLTTTITQDNQANSQQAKPAKAVAGTEEQQTKVSQEAKQGTPNVQNVPSQKQSQGTQPQAEAVQGTGKAGNSGNSGSVDAGVSKQAGSKESDADTGVRITTPTPTNTEKTTVSDPSIPPLEDAPTSTTEQSVTEVESKNTQKEMEESKKSVEDSASSEQDDSSAVPLGEDLRNVKSENPPKDSESTGNVEQQTDATVSPHYGLTTLRTGKEHNKQEQFLDKDGKLKPLGEIYRRMNRAAAWLTQKHQATDNADPAKSYPLVDIPDLVSKIKDGTMTIDSLVNRDLSE